MKRKLGRGKWEYAAAARFVCGVCRNKPYYSTLLNFNPRGHHLALIYEVGIDSVPRFDEHLAIYGSNKTVSVTRLALQACRSEF